MFRIPVYASSALDDGVVMAIACSGVALCGSPDAPRLDWSNNGVMVMQDTNPAQLGTQESGMAYPARSLYQTACSALKVMLEITWQPRATSGVVSWVERHQPIGLP
jgi:hypothetical protein